MYFIVRTVGVIRRLRVFTYSQAKSLSYESVTIHKQRNMKAYEVDLRSDTFTKPTPEMRQAMFEAEVGDDVAEEDPTVKELENKTAALFGKEAGLFVPSGTMGNLLAVMTHCDRRGCEVIVGDLSHIYKYEQANSAHIAGVQLCMLKNKEDGTFDLNEMMNKIREDDDHEPYTSLIVVENTHNMCGGKVIPLEWLDEVAEKAISLGIPLHMDGARIFSASVYSKIPVSRITRDFASVSVCLSKNLSAPVGTVLVGDAKFIRKARRFRKALGGGMRQAGVIAAAGIVALDKMIERLADDHRRAAHLGQAIADIGSKNFRYDPSTHQTNILIIEVNPECVTAQEFCKRLSMVTEEEAKYFQNKAVIIKAYHKNESSFRFVTYNGITDDDIQLAISKLKYVIEEYDKQ